MFYCRSGKKEQNKNLSLCERGQNSVILVGRYTNVDGGKITLSLFDNALGLLEGKKSTLRLK